MARKFLILIIQVAYSKQIILTFFSHILPKLSGVATKIGHNIGVKKVEKQASLIKFDPSIQ